MKKLICILLSAVFLLAAACGETATPVGTPSASATPAATAEPSPTATAEPQPSKAPYIDPLSGVGMDEDISAKRPWAVMINNLQQALPQCGVSKADILYEVPAEGGVTRMMAIFSDISDVEALGSMRSIRPYYADIALSYDALVVHAGGSDAGYSLLKSNGQEHLDGVRGSYQNNPFYRDSARMQYGVEHSMFTTGEKLLATATEEGFHFDHDGAYDYHLSFSDTAADQCTEKAEYVKVSFNGYKTTSFTYDAATGLYTAYEYGANYVDGNTGDNMTFRNLMVLTTSISVVDSVGRLSVKLTGEGDGYFICGGKYVPITWQRDSSTSAFRYYLSDGSELDLSVGNTYVGIMSSDSSAKIAFEKN
jgi:hypothetical protein